MDRQRCIEKARPIVKNRFIIFSNKKSSTIPCKKTYIKIFNQKEHTDKQRGETFDIIFLTSQNVTNSRINK